MGSLLVAVRLGVRLLPLVLFLCCHSPPVLSRSLPERVSARQEAASPIPRYLCDGKTYKDCRENSEELLGVHCYEDGDKTGDFKTCLDICDNLPEEADEFSREISICDSDCPGYRERFCKTLPSTTNKPTPPTTTTPTNHTGAIVGGIFGGVGGIVLIVSIVAFIFCLKRLEDLRTNSCQCPVGMCWRCKLLKKSKRLRNYYGRQNPPISQASGGHDNVDDNPENQENQHLPVDQ